MECQVYVMQQWDISTFFPMDHSGIFHVAGGVIQQLHELQSGFYCYIAIVAQCYPLSTLGILTFLFSFLLLLDVLAYPEDMHLCDYPPHRIW